MTSSLAAPKKWLLLWLLLTTIWGFSFFFIKVAGSFLDPYEQTFARMGFGALALISMVVVTRRKFIVRGPAVKHLALISVFAQVIPFTIFAWAIHYISSIAAGSSDPATKQGRPGNWASSFLQFLPATAQRNPAGALVRKYCTAWLPVKPVAP